MPEESDAVVIATSLSDSEQFGLLFDRHATVLFRYLARRVSVDHADLLLGEVFRVAFEKRATYDCTKPNARPWLYGIATNLLAHHRRSEARRLQATARLLATQVQGADPMDLVTSELEAASLWPAIAQKVAELPDPERDVLMLFAWEDLSYEEIAAALGIPVGTVRSRLNRARRHVRELRTPIGRHQ